MLGHKTWFSARFLHLFILFHLFASWKFISSGCNVGQGPLILLSFESLLETRQMRYMITIVLQYKWTPFEIRRKIGARKPF